jgi:hypothetical protein
MDIMIILVGLAIALIFLIALIVLCIPESFRQKHEITDEFLNEIVSTSVVSDAVKKRDIEFEAKNLARMKVKHIPISMKKAAKKGDFEILVCFESVTKGASLLAAEIVSEWAKGKNIKSKVVKTGCYNTTYVKLDWSVQPNDEIALDYSI